MGDITVYIAEAMDSETAGGRFHVFLADERSNILDEAGRQTGDALYLIGGEGPPCAVETELPLSAEFGIFRHGRRHYGDFFVRKKYRLSPKDFEMMRRKVSDQQSKYEAAKADIENRHAPIILDLEERVRKKTAEMRQEIEALGPLPSIKDVVLHDFFASDD